MAIEIGRRGKLYIKTESAYGETLTAHASADAVRHTTLGITTDPFNRVTSQEKKASPGAVTRFDRRVTAELATLECLLRPSGTLNTLPEASEVLEAAFGTKTNETLSTTVAASPAPTVNTFTVVSVGTLVVGDAVLVNIAAQTAGARDFVRIISAINTLELVVEPDLPEAPATGDTVKGCITYKLGTTLAISLAIAHHHTTFKRALVGVGVNKLELVFDGNEEPTFNASGPAKEQFTGGGVPTVPAAFTTVGGNPPSGLIGDLFIDNTALPFKRLSVALVNGLVVRNTEYGQSKASELYRNERRTVELVLDTFAETEATLYDVAEAGTNPALFKQTGRTPGNIVALRMPQIEVKVPDTDDPDTEVSWAFKGIALESADAQNDELVLVFA